MPWGLIYNINFDIASAVILSVILVYLVVQFPVSYRASKLFRNTVIAALFMTVSDILSAITLSYADQVPAWICILTGSMYFLGVAMVLFEMISYIRAFTDPEKVLWEQKSFWLLDVLPVGLLVLLLVINAFTGCLFYMDADSQYQYGPLHLMTALIPLYYFVRSVLIAFGRNGKISTQYRVAVILFVCLAGSAVVIQNIWLPDYLLSCTGTTLAILVMLISLETPEYQKMAETMEEVRQAKEEATAANQAKSVFLATMSHEIRTPINGVLGMNTMILKQKKLSPEVRECALNIQSSGRGLLTIINDILDLSKIESGEMELVIDDYQLQSVINDSYQMVIFRAMEKKLELKVEIDPSMPVNLCGDPTRVRQIIVNLLTNAVKYTEHGTVTWSMNWQRIDEKNAMLDIRVADTGIGISEENLGRLFQAFERMDTRKNRNIEGTGLGLRITKQLIDLMNGTIEVSSTYGEGSVFHVMIPQPVKNWEAIGLYVPKAEESEENITVNFSAPRAKVLVVDDVTMNLRVFKGLLRNTGIDIDTALSGMETLEKVSKTKYDIIFLDHMMPGMNGVETLQYMKKLPENLNQNTPVVMLTANAIVGAREEYLEIGFNDYLSKPIKEQTLRQMLLNYLPNNKVIREA